MESFHASPVSLLSFRERFRDSRSLEMTCIAYEPAEVAGLLAALSRLERLTLNDPIRPISSYLPQSGLHGVRHFKVWNIESPTDTELAQLVERLPALESLSLHRLHRLTPQGLAVLGQLPALSSLSLQDITGITDCWLAQLSAVPLVELQLGGSLFHEVTFSAGGLLRLAESCPTLRRMVLRVDSPSANPIVVNCGPGADSEQLLQKFQEYVHEQQKQGLSQLSEVFSTNEFEEFEDKDEMD